MSAPAWAPTLRALPRRRAGDASGVAFTVLTAFAAFLIVLMVAIIMGNITWFGWRTVTWEFLTANPRVGMTEGGILPAIFGTVALVILMVIALVPFGVGAAIYLSEYANPNSWFTRAVRFSVNNLAGVPSIVFGLFGLGFFIQFVGRSLDRATGQDLLWGQPSLLWAALTLALLNLPVVIVTAEEALRTVPREMREASMGLGATRWQTIRYVLLPQALPGILTGAILSVSRGAGEVAPIMFTGAAYFLPYLPSSPTDQFMELGYHVFVLSTQSPNVEQTKPILYGTVLVLLLITFLLNLTAILLRARLRARLAGRH
ncbi:MAG: phosphate ABC transporter permease PstA [Candidatus Eisenbacteria bacterium]|uniref:Phosphate transport system permease protein PstA n=1 Tax=Eiseniibacteriota bacterium TaxID=2212470 RepID=A0A849SJK9_UNCEI|nr:phosphate ABC transporter permease PstA [Candidatus Eisenbacteria bacterium]